MIIPLLIGGYAAAMAASSGHRSTPYDTLFVELGGKHDVDPNLLRAIAKIESNYRLDVVSGKTVSSAGAIGLMQIMPATARTLGVNPSDLVNPRVAIGTACRLLKSDASLLGKAGKFTFFNWIASYNAGGPAVLKRGSLAADGTYVSDVFNHWIWYTTAGVVYGRA